MDKKDITGIILCGGKSKRMGMEKGLVILNGKPLIEHSIDLLDHITPQVLISSNSHSFSHLQKIIIYDVYPDSGPMGGIYSCLINSKTDINIVLSCDTPFIRPELLQKMVNLSEAYDVVVPWYKNEMYEPLCAVYKKSIIQKMQEFIFKKNYKIPDLFKEVNTYKFPLYKSDYDKSMFLNVNTKEDLALAETRIRKTK